MTDQQADTIIALLSDILRELKGAPKNDDRLLNVTDAAEFVGVTRQTIARYTREGRIRKVFRGGKKGYLESELIKAK